MTLKAVVLGQSGEEGELSFRLLVRSTGTFAEMCIVHIQGMPLPMIGVSPLAGGQ
jgi:hypothetical protein